MRVFIPTKERERFINKIFLKISVKKAADSCSLSERTIRDWRRGKFLISLRSLEILCKKTKIAFPQNVEIRDDYWYVARGSSAGGIAVFKKYGRVGGSPEYRKKKWHEWWEREGKYKPNIITAYKPITKPRYSQNLAEFVGIMLGDGCISKNQISITLHKYDDKDYSKFVVSLAKKLFNVYVGTYNRKRELVTNYYISRTKLVHFCIDNLGLKQGNKIKQQVDIPSWIKEKKSYSVACLRGLIDTDGCVFTHRYKVNNKIYSYKKISFTSYSKPLLYSVAYIFRNIGLKPRFTRNGREIRIDSQKDVKKYFTDVGSHNQKHLKRYKK